MSRLPGSITWPLAQAKAKLSEVIRAARKTPQVIASDGTPAAVVIAIEEYEELMSLRQELILQRRRKAMAKLKKLNAVNTEDDFELPKRTERSIPDFGRDP